MTTLHRYLFGFLSISLITVVSPTQIVARPQGRLDSSRQQKDLPDLVAATKPSVVTILAYSSNSKKDSQGTGFFVGPGRIVTNRHVVKNANRVEVRLASGNVIKARGVLSEDKIHDLVILDVESMLQQMPALNLSAEAPREGERIFIIGSPLGLELTVSEGIVSAVRNLADFGTIIQVTAPISPGSSGSPVLTLDGRVVAVASFQYIGGQALNFGIASTNVLSMQISRVASFTQQFGTTVPSVGSDDVIKRSDSQDKNVDNSRQNRRNPSELLRAANGAWDKNDWETAARNYETLLKIVPDQPIALERGPIARDRASKDAQYKEWVVRERAAIPLYIETVKTYLSDARFEEAAKWLVRIGAVERNDKYYLQQLPIVTKYIVDKHIKALGGREVFKKVGTARFDGSVSFGDGTAIPFSWVWKRPNKFRFEMLMAENRTVRAYDGSVGWIIDTATGDNRPRRLPDEELSGLKQMADFEGPLLEYEIKGNRVSLAGIEKIGDSAAAYRLDVITSLGESSSFLINTEDFLIYAVDEERNDLDQKAISRSVFGQYSVIDGIRFAREYITSIKPSTIPISTLSISRIEINCELNDSLVMIPNDKETERLTILTPVVLSSSNLRNPVRGAQAVIPRLYSSENLRSDLQGRIAFVNAIKPILNGIEAWIERKDGTRLILLVGICADGQSLAKEVVGESRTELQKVGFLELVIVCENGSRYAALVP